MRLACPKAVAVIAECLWLLSCGGGGAALVEPPPPEFTSIAITPDSVSVPVGGVVLLTATPRDQNGTAISGLASPTWSVEDTAIATATGNAITGKAIGSTRVFASMTEAGVTRGDTARVVVTAAPAGSPAHPVNTPGTSFSPGTVSITVGDSVTWLFLGAVHNVTFIPGGPIPPGGDIPDQASGQVVSRTFTAAGTYQYECTRHANMTGQVLVQSGQPQLFTSVSLTPGAASLLVGGTIQLTADPLDQNGVPIVGLAPAAYTSSALAVATVSSSGLVTAGGPGSATITASITGGATTRTATSAITVNTPAPGATVTTPNLTFAPSTATIQAGQTVTWDFSGAVHNVTFFTAVPPGFNIPDQPVGSVIPRTFPTAGVYTYECTRHANMAGTVIVQSGQTQLFTSVGVSPATTNLVVGGTVPLTATPLDQSGVPMAGLPAANFATSSAAIATVSSAGVVTATGAGTANITATITSGATTHSATATVLVTAPSPGGVTVTTTNNNTFSPAAAAIAVGGIVTWQFGNGTHNVTWNAGSQQPPGGDIPDQSAGTQSRAFPTAGNYTYQCTRHNGMTGSVTVSGGGAPGYSSLDVQPLSPSVAVGSTVQLIATPLDQNGSAMPGLPAATFASSDAAVAIVSTGGLVTGVTQGTATITASLTANGATHTAASIIAVGSGPGTIVTTPGLFFNPDDVKVPPGTTVIWQISGTAHNITFETIAPPGGNIGTTAPGNSVSRTFTQLGEYRYFCSIHGFDGKVRVE